MPTANNIWSFNACSRVRVRDLVTLGVGGAGGLYVDFKEGTGFTGNNKLRCKVLTRPLPSSWRTVKTGIEALDREVTTQISSSKRSANLFLPCSPTFRTMTWSPCTILSYRSLLASPAYLILASTHSLAPFVAGSCRWRQTRQYIAWGFISYTMFLAMKNKNTN